MNNYAINSYNYNLSNPNFGYSLIQMRRNMHQEKLGNAADTVENTVNNVIDTIGDQNTSKSTRIAIYSGISGALLIGGIALLNPRYSGKFASKLKNMQVLMQQKAKNAQNNLLKSKFYNFLAGLYSKTTNAIGFINNVNSVKDIAYKKISTVENAILESDKWYQRVGKTLRNAHVKVMKKPHEWISGLGDELAKITVNRNYRRATKSLEELEGLINRYATNLPKEEAQELKNLLTKLNKLKGDVLTENKVAERLKKQENILSDLEDKTWVHFKEYMQGFRNKEKNTGEHIVENLNFWAERFTAENAKVVQSGGTARVESFSEVYKKALEIVEKSKSLNDAEKSAFKKQVTEFESILKKANNSECVEYFGKKRDLTLGSAPTDIVSALVLGGAAGAAIINADDKEERISKTVTKAVPTFLGVISNICMTAMMISGSTGLLAATGISLLTSKLGSIFDEKVLGHKHLSRKEKRLLKQQMKAEVKNA